MSHRPAMLLLLCAFLLPAVPLLARQAASSSLPKTASAAKGAAPAQKPEEKTDVCQLLTRAEIQGVQNEPVEETKPSAQPSGGFQKCQRLYRPKTLPQSGSRAPPPPQPATPPAA